MADPFLTRARRALRRGPRYLWSRAGGVARQQSRKPWTSIYPRLLTESAVCRALGASSVDVAWDLVERQPFLLDGSRRQEYVRSFDHTFPDRRNVIVAQAERVLAHEFDLLGSGPRQLGAALPWHADFKTGREWPLEYAADMQYLELDRPTDVKLPWELSRCQHFTTLGQAYWLTNDETFAREYVAEIDDWIAKNPWGYGVNWACPMDVALRAVSWIWGFHFFSRSAACEAQAFRRGLLRSLALHGEYTASHLERGDINGNHYLCDAVGLVFIGALLGASSRGREWLRLGRDIVATEIFNQVTDDGVDFEQSIAYHRLVLEAFVTAFLLLRRVGQDVGPDAWDRVERMHEFVASYLKPDGSIPLIGDADDGRIQKLGTQTMNDHRYLLATGAVLFDRADLKAAAGAFADESFWLLGPEGSAAFERIPASSDAETSRAFPDGGFIVLRNRHAHLIVDCGEVGMRGRGGHGHNDVLSFELWLSGFNIVTDCGAYLYTASREWRNRFRSTASHNVVQIDGEELNRFAGADALWQLMYDAAPADVEWGFGPNFDRMRASHRGYDRLPSPVRVTRELVLHHADGTVTGRDSLSGAGAHEAIWRFHLDPSVVASIQTGAVRLASRGREAWFQVLAAPFEPDLRLESGWVSPTYGVKHETSIIVVRHQTVLPVSLCWSFSPRPRTETECATLLDGFRNPVMETTTR